MWSRALLCIGFLLSASVAGGEESARTVTQAEYFWGSDPGAGNGTAMLALDGNLDEVIESVLANGVNVPAGLGAHSFNVRVKDAEGVWGPLFTTMVTSFEPSVSPVRSVQVTQAEYFWDTDPGVGNGITMLALDGNLDEVIESVLASGVAVPAGLGAHSFNVRVKDAEGVWGPLFTTVVAVSEAGGGSLPREVRVAQAEHFWDTDPGEGNGTAMLALDGNLDEVIESVLASGVTVPAGAGAHSFNVRVKDAEGVWGPLFTTMVTSFEPSVSPTRSVQVAQAEYFWDTDPGAGNGTTMLALDGNLDEVIETVLASGVSVPSGIGAHSLNVRVKDAEGVWGPLFTTMVHVESAPMLFPDIVVEFPSGTSLIDADPLPVHVGTVIPDAHVDSTFVIKNVGAANLQILETTISGTDTLPSSHFTVHTAPTATVAPGGSTSLVIRFAPLTAGVKMATLRIYSDDADESPFDLVVSGTGNTSPAFTGVTVETVQGSPVPISEAKILLRATDAEEQTLSITGIAPTSASGVAVTRAGGVITYATPVVFTGTDTFTVTLSDGISSIQGTITVNVAADPGLNPRNPPRITVLGGGAVGVGFFGIPGRIYGIQRSTDLSNWTQIAAPTAATNGQVQIEDPSPPQPASFYRIVFPAQ